MFLEIITPEKKLYEGEVQMAAFPGVDGSFQVLDNHAPLVSSLQKGAVEYRDKKATHSVEITGGIVEVLNNQVVVLAEGTI